MSHLCCIQRKEKSLAVVTSYYCYKNVDRRVFISQNKVRNLPKQVRGRNRHVKSMSKRRPSVAADGISKVFWKKAFELGNRRLPLGTRSNIPFSICFSMVAWECSQFQTF